MTQYVRGKTPSIREYWREMIGSERVPVKDGKPRLSMVDRLLGRHRNAYYVLDADSLDASSREMMIRRLAASYSVPEKTAEKWLRNFKILAKTVERLDNVESESCPGCGIILPEKGIKFCPKCGIRLSRGEDELKSGVVDKPRIIEEDEPEEGGLIQVKRVENSIMVKEEDLAVKANDFRIVWGKVLSLLEFMHENFDLVSITFDEDGKAKPRFRTRQKR